MSLWYYADAERRQHGPIDAEALARLHVAGQLRADTLVWRDGLPAWQPWAQVMAEVLPATALPRPTLVDAVPALEPAPSERTPSEPAPSQRMPSEPVPSEPAPTDSAAPPAVDPRYDPYAMAVPAAIGAASRSRAAGHAAAAAQAGAVVYAGFWKRVAASIIDSVVLALLPLAQLVLSGGREQTLLLGWLLSLVLQMAYFAGFHASSLQATPGKLAVGIKVAGSDGRRIPLGLAVGRYLGYLLSGLLLGVGYLMAAFTDRKRALHDLIADTVVVDRWAYTDHPERQRGTLGAVTVLVLVLAALALAALAATAFLLGALLLGSLRN